MERKATIYDFVRMCNYSCGNCSVCPFDVTEWNSCVALMQDNPKKYNDILLKWCDEHPVKKKTYKQDFLEKFPNAKQCHPGRPALCRGDIYGNRIQVCDTHRANCTACWNEEMPDD